MITRTRLEWLRANYDGREPEDVHIRTLADAYEEQRDNALKAWRVARSLATIARMPADVEQAEKELSKLKETLK